MKPMSLYLMLMNTNTKEEFLRLLRANRERRWMKSVKVKRIVRNSSRFVVPDSLIIGRTRPGQSRLFCPPRPIKKGE